MYRPYSELGKLLDALARERDVRGPYQIAHFIKDVTGYEVSGQSVSKYLYGEQSPKSAFISAFAEAFELTRQERHALAWTCVFGFWPEDEESAIKAAAPRASRRMQPRRASNGAT